MIRRLLKDERGTEIIAFALVLPVLLLMGLGGLETARFGYANLRVSQIAMTAADNAGRVRNQITEADINELLTGAKFVGKGIDFAENGRIIVSSLESNGQTDASKKGNMIRWQRCSGKMAAISAYGTEGKGATDSTLKDGIGPELFKPSPDKTKLLKPLPDTAIMYVEVSYTYQPVVASRWINEQTIKAERAFNVRQRTDQVLKAGGVADADISKCTKYSA